MKTKNKERKTWFKGVQLILAQVWKTKKRYYLYIILEMLRRSAYPLILVFFPKLLIDSLEMGDNRLAIGALIGFALGTLSLEVLGHFLEVKIQIIEQDLQEKLSISLSRKMMSLPYEVMESKEKLDELHFAKQCMEQGSIGRFVNLMILGFSSILTLTSIFFVVLQLQSLIVLAILLVVFIQVICEKKRADFEYDLTEKSSTIERNLYYARDGLTDYSYAKEVRLFQLSNFIEGKIKHYSEAYCMLQEEAANKTVKLFAWTYLIASVQQFISYGYLAIVALGGEISVGDLSLYLTAIGTFRYTLGQLAKTSVDVMTQNRYLLSLADFLAEKREQVFEGKESISSIKSITFDQVSFTYPEATSPSLEEITLRFEMGKKYSIVGANGAGKTTLIKLMMGFYQQFEGQILINDNKIEGRTDKDNSEEAFQNWFSPVFQDFKILAYSIAENIAMDQVYDEERIYHVLEAVGLKEKVETLAQGIHTAMNRDLDQDGTEFSIGEKQKLALARALYKGAPIYILDEPTAALSPQAEYDLYEKFEKVTEGKMVCYISHRLSSCKLCDEIIVLDQGKVVEQGSFQDLIEKKGLFYDMFQVQASQFHVKEEEGYA